MDIKIGKIKINKTKKYLLPCLKVYGQEFMSHINSLFKLGVGIGDVIATHSSIDYNEHIFILVDTSKYLDNSKKIVIKEAGVKFTNTLKWLKSQEFYEDDYIYDLPYEGELHMIVLKFPRQYRNALVNFKKGKFTKMFSSKKEIEEIFMKNKETVYILTGEKKYEFMDKINKEYFLTEKDYLKPEQFPHDLEVDFPPKREEEYFNAYIFKTL